MGTDPHRHRAGPPVGPVPAAQPAWAGEELRDVRPPLAVDTVATAHQAGRLRRAFAEWLAIDVTGDVLDDLVLAVYEAIANIADHAYTDRDAAGPARLTAHRSRSAVRITVADEGRWAAPSGEPYRSRGLPMIRRLVTDMHVSSTARGTVVHLHATLPPPGAVRDLPHP